MAEESESEIAHLDPETQIALPSNHNESQPTQSEGHELIPLNDETLVSDGELAVAVPSGNEIARLNPETQIALLSNQNESQPTQSEVVIAGGTHHGAHIGPKTTKNVVEAHDFRNAKITHTHIHYHSETAASKEPPVSVSSTPQRRKLQTSEIEEESPSTSGATGGRPKLKPGEECVQLSDSIWFYKNRRLANKANIFEGVETSKIYPDQLLAIKFFWHYTKENKREAKNLRTLRPHTHVVSIAHADVYKGMPGVNCLYIAMERCSNLNLEDYIKERRSKNVPFNPDTAFEHAKQLIDAINHIHGYNIMHRDLKPSSVLFSLSNPVLKICDFGMSKELENGHSVTGLSKLKVGTDGYRAPETYIKNVISKMADIFSLALVLYHLLSYGFHPFGIDPEIWSYNIKNDRGLDLSRLRDPFLKIVKELLEQMLKSEPRSRLKIDQVKNSESMKLDWISSLIESLVPIWNGVIKDHVGADKLSCRLYRSPSLQDVIEIDESGRKFQMNTVPYLNIGSLKKVTDKEPSGYIVTTKDELKKLTDELTRNNLVGWIDVSKDGKDSKVIVLLFQPGYPELFGFFLPDTKILTSLIGTLASKQRSTSQKPTAAQSSESPDHTRESTNLRDHSRELSSTSAEHAPISMETSDVTSRTVDQDPTEEQEAASTTNQWKQTSSGLIPWWIFTEDLQK